jgi:hypothetical protein
MKRPYGDERARRIHIRRALSIPVPFHFSADRFRAVSHSSVLIGALQYAGSLDGPAGVTRQSHLLSGDVSLIAPGDPRSTTSEETNRR